MSRRRLGLIAALCAVLAMVGIFYAYYYSWIVTTPGLSDEARAHYDFVARLLGIPSLVLLGASLIGGVWILLRKKT